MKAVAIFRMSRRMSRISIAKAVRMLALSAQHTPVTAEEIAVAAAGVREAVVADVAAGVVVAVEAAVDVMAVATADTVAEAEAGTRA